MSEEKSKKSPSESFAEMMKNFGTAVAEIFNDPELKEKAKDFGDSASASAKAFAERFKDEEVKGKFKDLGDAAKKFGESISDYFNDEKGKSQQAGENNPEEPKKKQENETAAAMSPNVVAVTDLDVPGGISSSKKAKEDASRARNSRITGYSFSIAWSIIFIIFFNFFNQYIAYYDYNAVTGNWEIIPVITAEFYEWLPIFNVATIVVIIGNIILIINDSFYFENITNIIMHIFGIASVSVLLSLFPFDFSVMPDADLSQLLNTITMIVLIFIIVGLSVGILVRFIRIIVKIARVS